VNKIEFNNLIENISLDTNQKENAFILLYTLYAWKTISKEISNDNYKFESFYNNEITVDKLYEIFNNIKESFVFIDSYFEIIGIGVVKFGIPLSDNDLIKLCNILIENDYLPNVSDGFNIITNKNNSKLGDIEYNESLSTLISNFVEGDSIYIPFNSYYDFIYKIKDFKKKKIYSESNHISFYDDLMRILDNVDITHHWTENTLLYPTFVNSKASHLLEQFDCVVAFPPMNQKDSSIAKKLSEDKYNRFKIHKGSSLDVAQFEHILTQTKNKAIVVMPVGFTYRSGVEEEFRKYLINKNYLEAIIQLPPNLNPSTSIETTIVIINKNKKDSNTLFINLKNDDYLTKEKRKIILTNIDDIAKIYHNKNEINNVSKLITHKEIENNNYSFSIDRYVVSNEVSILKEQLKAYNLVELQDIATIRRSQQFKEENEGIFIHELSPSDFTKSGLTSSNQAKYKRIGSQEKKLPTYQLENLDLLLSVKGTIGKIALINYIDEEHKMITSQASVIIRLNNIEKNSDEHYKKMVCIYMYLKSDFGQSILKQLVSGVAMPQISTEDIKKLQIPIFKKEEEKRLSDNFKQEQILYNEINKISIDIKQIHNNFLGVK
jgi:type I restriction enzyme M protein